MKKIFALTTCFLFTVLLSNAQLTLYSGGTVGICPVSYTPPTGYQCYIINSQNVNGGIGCFTQGPGIGNAYSSFGIVGHDTTGYAGGVGSYAVGVQGGALNASPLGSGRNYGVYGYAGNSTAGYNYGVYGTLFGDASSYGACIFGTTAGDVSIPGLFAGYFNGALLVTTDYAYKASTPYWFISSDKRLKKNITSFTDGLNVIRKINPVTYQFSGIGGMPTADTNIGVLAQDLQKVARYCVGTRKMVMKQSDASAFSNDIVSSYTDTNGTAMVVVNSLTMNPNGMFYAMINSIKQLDSTVTSLKKQLDSCCNINSNIRHAVRDSNSGTGKTSDTTTTQIELSNNTDIVLYQNQPNPFTGSTVIRYFIPQTVSGTIYISFSDTYGVEIKRVPITVMGFGNIDAGTQNLVSGVYTYSLVVNGTVIDTKKMIKTQ